MNRHKISELLLDKAFTIEVLSVSVAEASTGLQEINQNLAHRSSVMEEAIRDISKMSELSQQINAGTDRIDNGSNEFSNLDQDLNEMVDKFKV